MTSPRLDLIERRKALGFTQATLATVLDVQVTTVARWEQGLSNPRSCYRQPLARALQIGLLELDRLLNPTERSSRTSHPVPTWLTHYESLVMAAGQLAQVEVLIIPALLQTRAYATVVEQYGPLLLSDDEVTERVDRRLARQSVLHRQQEPLHLHAVLSEVILCKNVGGETVMVEQLDHLITLSQMHNVEIQLIPADGRDACVVSGFEMLTKPDDDEPFMVCTFDVGGARYWEDSYHRDRFTTMLNYLSGEAYGATETVERMRSLRGAYRCSSQAVAGVAGASRATV